MQLEDSTITYVKIRDALLEHFESEMLSKVRQLQELKQGNSTIYDHNTRFMSLAAAAGKMMGDISIKDCYIDSLTDYNVSMMVASLR